MIGLLLGPFGLLVAFYPKFELPTHDGSSQPIGPAITPAQAKALSPKDEKFEEEWNNLVKYDPKAQEAVKKLEDYGDEALEELKKAYNVVKYKDRLPQIAYQIISELETKRQEEEQEKKVFAAKEQELMKQYNIIRYQDKYVYGEYKYDNLEDALRFAEDESKK
jgi:hypothetical protein